MAVEEQNVVSKPTKATVPLREGPPTSEELLVHYPAKFTWKQLRTFVNSGDLGLLKRDRTLQKRYDDWAVGIREQYGSLVDYLLNHRLQWGQRDTLSLLPSSLEDDPRFYASTTTDASSKPAPQYFTADTPPEYLSIIQNDWPYSVPPEVEHTLIWTKVAIFHPALVDGKVKARIDQDGLWGFTGSASPPPSPSTLPECLPALAEWGITLESMITSQKGTKEEERLVKRAGEEVDGFVRKRWDEKVWETAWFVNPPPCKRYKDNFKMSKIVLVTGGNAGIGYELVKALASKPEVQKVYLAARSVKSGQDAQNKINAEGLNNVVAVQLDVTDTATIAAAKETIEKNEGRLDVLVNNAGISEMDKPQNATNIDVAIVRRTVETNLFGLIQTTTAFIPLLRKSPQAVILNVSTDMASNGKQAVPGAGLHVVAYNTSKAAANSYTIALSQELRAENIKVNAVTPGFTTTKLNGHAPGGKTSKDAAEILLPWALLDKDGATGLFIGEDGKEYPW
ncbi:hypothetical protein H1R20_g3705, partial [Candolleomyces eurysporus]